MTYREWPNPGRIEYFDWCDSVEVLTIQGEKNKIYKIYKEKCKQL
jgi:hypothetical protein